MYDIIKNHRIENIRYGASQEIGTANQPDDDGFDLWENNQLPNQVLIMVFISSVGTDGTLDLIVQDSIDQSTWDEDFITVAQMTAAGTFLIEVNDPNRYIRVNATAAVDAVIWGASFMTFQDQRRPVTQSGTLSTLTYGTLRKPKVASS